MKALKRLIQVFTSVGEKKTKPKIKFVVEKSVNGEWILVGTREVYEDPSFNLTDDAVAMILSPRGSVGDRVRMLRSDDGVTYTEVRIFDNLPWEKYEVDSDI